MNRRYKLTLFFVAITIAALVFTTYQNTERKGDRALTMADYRQQLRDLKLSPASELPTVNEAQAALGRRLFFDKRLSSNKKINCAFCHEPQLAFTDAKPRAVALGESTRNTPTIVNSALNFWFNWDGRADSLSAQAGGPLEHPLEHGTSRTNVAQLAYQFYRHEFQNIYGAWDDRLMANLPEHALPEPPALDLPAHNAAYALTTLQDFTQLASIMRESKQDNRSPAMQFSHMVMQMPTHNPEWYAQWQAMPEEQRSYINTVYWRVTEALAAYVSMIYSKPAPFDRFAERVLADDSEDLVSKIGDGFGLEELEGFKIFVGRGECTLCHNGPNFTNNQFHNTGLAALAGRPIDVGRAKGVVLSTNDPFNCLNAKSTTAAIESCTELPYLDLENVELVGAFKTPSLRHIAETAPYFHDGRAETLNEVVDFYDRLEDKPAIGHREESMRRLNLSDTDKANIIAFLRSLSSEVYERSRQ